MLTNSTINYDMPTYTDNPYLSQCQSIPLMVLLCMLAPVWRLSMTVVVKKLKIYKINLGKLLEGSKNYSQT